MILVLVMDRTIFIIIYETLSNLSWGPNSPHNFDIGDLQQEETNWNADFTYPMGDINLAFGAEWREEKYIMYEGQKEAWMPGPWAMVHLL